MIEKCSQVLCLSPALNSSLKLCCFKKQQIGAVQRVLASVRVRTRERACTLFYVYFYFSTCIEQSVTSRLETSRYRDFSQFFESIGLGLEIFGLEKKSRYRSRKYLVSKKSLGIGLENI